MASEETIRPHRPHAVREDRCTATIYLPRSTFQRMERLVELRGEPRSAILRAAVNRLLDEAGV